MRSVRLLSPSPSRLSRVDLASIRVALAATGVVLAVNLFIAAGMVVIVQQYLTSQVDAQLASSLRYIATEPPPPEHDEPRGGPPGGEPPGGPRFGPRLVIWTFYPDGGVTCTCQNTVLPAQYRSVHGPLTTEIGGSPLRIQGQAVGSDYVVVGLSMDGVYRARSTVIFAEAIIGPILLLATFLGALTIGRHVAAPIEHVRRRQMEFTADASHELRTPLSVIEATTTLALSRQRDADWYRSSFERVHVESRRMRRLVVDLLWLARFDSLRAQPDAEPVDLGVIAQQAVDRFRTMAEARSLALSLNLGDQAAVVVAPPEWLDRLLGVLLDNACKYSGAGGSVDVAVRAEGGRVRLVVDDSGPGIPAEERSTIFDRFHRASEQARGAGLGLAIANAVVGATGGRWDVGCSPAGGASMAVSWPRGLAGGPDGFRSRQPAAPPA
ncbi:MAG: HAMP domain-containing histidine kinase [Candidatus Dormibacteraeota bacterium]|nr:HAMP domain-containing histidine kinase [Candidatus Dormibacteraeota bacterium]